MLLRLSDANVTCAVVREPLGASLPQHLKRGILVDQVAPLGLRKCGCGLGSHFFLLMTSSRREG